MRLHLQLHINLRIFHSTYVRRKVAIRHSRGMSCNVTLISPTREKVPALESDTMISSTKSVFARDESPKLFPNLIRTYVLLRNAQNRNSRWSLNIYFFILYIFFYIYFLYFFVVVYRACVCVCVYEPIICLLHSDRCTVIFIQNI